jgi:hypothetical protein
VAGLLAAAAPASAMPAGVNTGQENDALTAAQMAPRPNGGILIGEGLTHDGGFVKATAIAGTQVGSEG